MKEKNEIHYFEVHDLVTQFVSAFDSIVIGRFEGREKKGSLKVRYAYAPKQKVLHDLVNKAQHITVPAIAVSVASISRDSDRVQSKNLGHYINGGVKNSYHVPQPVPVNIEINMSIIVRYQTDLDQILANFIPYNDPYIIISWKLPDEFAPSIGTELRSEVLWNENISIDQPKEMGESDKYRTTADTSFTIKGWLFKKHPDKAIGNIFEIDTRFYPISSLSDVGKELDVYDEFSLSAYPLIDRVLNLRLLNNQENTIKIEGDNFDFTSSVYLSSDNSNIFSESLSSYEDFDGIKLEETQYNIINDNFMYIDTGVLNDIGNIKVIVENPSGYDMSNN